MAPLLPGIAAALRALSAAPKQRLLPEDEDQAHALWRWIEDHAEVVFPAIGVLILALLVLAVRRGALSQREELRKRGLQKEQIVRLMRARLGLTAEAAGHQLGIDRYHAAALLEELEREGLLAQQRAAGGAATWRLKGL